MSCWAQALESVAFNILTNFLGVPKLRLYDLCGRHSLCYVIQLVKNVASKLFFNGKMHV